jgi:hypothetical protein
MTVVRLEVTQQAIHRHLDSATVHDIIWAFATPETGLEHVHVSAQGDHLHITLFSIARNVGEAYFVSTLTVDRACRESPLLAGWRIRSDSDINL